MKISQTVFLLLHNNIVMGGLGLNHIQLWYGLIPGPVLRVVLEGECIILGIETRVSCLQGSLSCSQTPFNNFKTAMYTKD